MENHRNTDEDSDHHYSSLTNASSSLSAFHGDFSIDSDRPSTSSWIQSPAPFGAMVTEEDPLHQFSTPPSIVYCQAVSSLQSPTTQSATRFIVDLNSPSFMNLTPAPVQITQHASSEMMQSPMQMLNSQFTSLEPVTPSRMKASPRKIVGNVTHSQIPISASVTPILNTSEPLFKSPPIHSSQVPLPVSVTPVCNTSPPAFKSPPTPFRLMAPDGSEFRPIISKKGNGKISITYPLNMLANASFREVNEPVITNEAICSSKDCFSQFLCHSNLFKKSTQNNVETENNGDGSQPTSSDNINITAGQKDLDNVDNEEENDEEKEERQSVQNITKALNLNCDIFSRKKRRSKKDRRNQLPKEVKGLMGEANLCYARGQHEDAIKMCMEIIRTAPWCHDPYGTLAMIYEERGETTKALQYSLLAAHLQSGDVDLWLRLAESCEDAGFSMQAANCYNKAMKLKPNDYKICWAAAVLQQQIGNVHASLVLFKSVVANIPESEVGQRMELARDIARACHANNETALALEVMDEVASKHPDDVKYEDVNVMCELAITSKQYRKVLVKHCQIEVQYESNYATDAEITEEDLEKVVDFTPTHVKIPEHLPVDLKCKCVLAAIPLQCFDIVEPVFKEICDLESAEYGDLQFDIAELLMEEGSYKEAIYALDILVSSVDYSLAAVWMKKGECHRALEERIKEMECFKEVIKRAPGHTKAYLRLCNALRALEKYKEASEVIKDAETYELEGDEQMLLNYEKFKIYYDWGSASKKSHEKFCKAGDAALLMFANRLQTAFVPSKTILVRKKRNPDKKYKGDIRVSRRVARNYFKYKDKKSLSAAGSATVLDNDEWWEFFLLMCEILMKTERYIDAITIVDCSLSYYNWYVKPDKRLKLERLACSLCMISDNYSLAYSFMRPWLLQRPNSNILWNLFNQVTIRSQDQRHHRFCLRSLVKEPDSIALAILTGHNSLATGTYKHSLGEYVRAHRQIPTEPLFMLLIGVIYTHISSQRFTTHKNSLVVQGLAFLHKYMQHRKCAQESCYNLGRAFHQLGLCHFAIQWYKKALATPPPNVDVDASLIDLKSEIGYNMAILYRKSGNHSLATQVLMKYCVI